MRKRRWLIGLLILLAVGIVVVVFCRPVSRVWFAEDGEMELVSVYLYENSTEEFSKEQQDAVFELLTGLETRGTVRREKTYLMDDYPVEILFWYAPDSGTRELYRVRVGKTDDLLTGSSDKLYRIVDGDTLETQLMELFGVEAK